MTTQDIRSAYLKFFADRGHVVIPRANLVPKEDATTLFTGSGMQPLVPYLLGAEHPAGTRLVDSQACFRAEDFDEVGDNRHTTFFEMLGNWGLGEYFKAEQLPWFFEFLTEVVGLDPHKLYVTAFIGEKAYDIPQDTESVELWQKLFKQKGIEPKVAEVGSEADGYKRGVKAGERIFLYESKKNWWNRGEKGPATTPVGDPCGPCAEVFYLFDHVEHDPKWGEHCHPNCDCGRYMEIGNSVFMQYRKREDGGLDALPKPNVDFGGGLERIAAAVEGSGDMFRISLLWPLIEELEKLSHKQYADHAESMRVIADHLKAAVFLAVDGVVPSNTAQGYVMRRFIRRALVKAHDLGLKDNFVDKLVPVITDLYRDAVPEIVEHNSEVIRILVGEEKQFRVTLERGVRELEKRSQDGLDGQQIFVLFDTYGFPAELTLDQAEEKGIKVAEDWQTDFDKLMAEQKDRSRTATAGQFKGGLMDHSEQVVKYHTATHLMYKALRIVLGDHVIQRGSNITPERLRFDFSHPDKMTPEQIAEVERIVNEQIDKDWPMGFREEKTADVLGKVLGAFGDRYGDMVKIYTVGDPDGVNYSREICGGPHVEHTGVLAEGGKRFKIKKEESSSAGVRRIKAVLE
ncbi:MAG TPA: alanine--tRNA ligase [Candidatus Saccharimonadia bacterium]|nr:alanine--tRNA ligase [Candidatus Saccharimonadia bacterium]